MNDQTRQSHRRLHRFMLCVSVVALGANAVVATANANDEPIATDRPDFVESAQTVGKGRLQIETSVAAERERSGGARSILTPTLFRAGIAEDVELRLETDGRVRVKDGPTAVTGSADVSAGLKWKFRDGDEKLALPTLALLVHADLASGSGPFRGVGTRPSVRAIAEWELPGEVAMGIMPGVFREHDGTQRYTGAILAATISKGWTGQFRTFIEIAGRQLAARRHGGNVVTIDGGATFQFTKNLQFDVAAYFGANDNSPDRAFTAGISVRF